MITKVRKMGCPKRPRRQNSKKSSRVRIVINAWLKTLIYGLIKPVFIRDGKEALKCFESFSFQFHLDTLASD